MTTTALATGFLFLSLAVVVVATETRVATTRRKERLILGFLPALTANVGQSKHFVGAFKYALDHINRNVLDSTPYELDYIVHDTKANTTVALRGMTMQYNNGSVAFIGPEDNCAIEARLAHAWNLPMISFVSTASRAVSRIIN